MASPLMLAAKRGETEKLEVLLAGTRRVDERDSCGWTALHWAVWGGEGGCVRLLVGAGADWGAKTDGGEGCEGLGGVGVEGWAGGREVGVLA